MDQAIALAMRANGPAQKEILPHDDAGGSVSLLAGVVRRLRSYSSFTSKPRERADSKIQRKNTIAKRK